MSISTCSVCMYVTVCMYVYVCMYVCDCVCVCMCMCVCVCIHLGVRHCISENEAMALPVA